MNNASEEKIDTIEGLARLVAEGFLRVETRLENVETRLENVETRLDKVEGRLENVETGLVALKSTVDNYLNLSERRYFELKQRDSLLAGWIQQLAKSTGTPIDTSVLEKV